MRPADLSPQTLPSKKTFATWQRWLAIGWLALWIPAYWRTWGPANFLQLCDIAMILTCVGIWSGSALLLSSQAVSSLLVDLVWLVDAGGRLVFGRHVIGGTEYLFDAQYPLWVRLLSLFHVVLPVLLLWSLRRVGYDGRGVVLQCAIALAAFGAARFTDPAKNINFAFSDPFLHWASGRGAAHAVANTLFMLVVAYLPTHAVLKRFFAPAGE